MRSFCVFLLLLAVLVAVNRQQKARVSADLPGPIPLDQATKVFPDAASTERTVDNEDGWTLVRGMEGDPIGMVLNTSPAMDNITGYAGPTPLLIGFDLQGNIESLALLDNRETPSFVKRVKSAGYLDHWVGLPYDVAQTTRVDSVSSATMTSDAIAQSIRGRLALIETDPERITTQPGFALATLNWQSMTMIFLLLCGIFVSLWPHSRKNDRYLSKIRFMLLSASIAILGFASARMFSIAQLEAIGIRGAIVGEIAIILLVGSAILVPLISGRNFYCHCICPFGGLQELLFRLSPIKVIRPQKGWQCFRAMRYGLLILVAISLVAGWGLEPDMQEPFAAFNWRSSGWIPLLLAGLALVASLLGINRPWCTYCCSSGALLDLLRTKRKRQPPESDRLLENPNQRNQHISVEKNCGRTAKQASDQHP